MFRDVPACSGMFRVPGFIDAPVVTVAQLNVACFFFHWALSFCFYITTGKTVGKNIYKGRLTSIFTCELKAMTKLRQVSFTLTSVQNSWLSLTCCSLT